MGTTQKARKFEIFSVHARTKAGAVDSYEKLFERIASAPPENRNHEQYDKILGLPIVSIRDGKVFLIAIEGPKGVSPLIYDSSNATMKIEKLSSAEIVGTRTHAIIDLRTREAVVEFNHRGAKASDIEYLIGHIARQFQEYDSLEFSLNMKVGKQFAEEVERFERVRVAKIKLARPNVDWNDSQETLAEIAQASNANHVSLEATAGRNQSLSKVSGLIAFLKDLGNIALSPVKGASITGVRAGETAETTVTTSQHSEHVKGTIKINPDGHADSDDVNARLMAILDARNPKQ